MVSVWEAFSSCFKNEKHIYENDGKTSVVSEKTLSYISTWLSTIMKT